MSRPKASAILLALVLAAGALAPRAAYARHAQAVALTDAPPAASEVAAAAVVEPAVEVEAAEPRDEKPKGNAFLRALSAPFRALGRLFGGGRKSSGAAARKRAERPAEVAARPAVAEPAVATPTAAAMPVPSALAGPSVPAVVDAAAAPPVVPIIRPDSPPSRPSAEPGVWVPFIESVGRDPLTQGRALLERGHLSEAIAELTVAASGTRNLVEANNLLGLAFDRVGDHRSAVESYERALAVSPKDPVLLANLGYSLYLSNDFGGALKRLRQAVRAAPELAVVHNHLGIVQARLGKYDDAFRSFARATGEYDAHLRLASILEFERRDKQAVKHYEAALRLQPDATAVLERLLALYERTGDRTKADTARRALGRPRNEQRTTTGGGG